MKILKIFIILVLAPLILGIFGEEIFGPGSNTLISILFSISIVGAVLVVVTNYRSGVKKIYWYIISSLFLVVNVSLLYLLVNFHPGF